MISEAPSETSPTDGGAWRRYVETRSEAAFAEVVRAHVDLVYAVALRRCYGETALAEDIVQIVFSDLVRKASRLPRNVVLAGWLHRHAAFVASNTLRGEMRRRRRERIAMELQEGRESTDWSRLAPVLDEALSELATGDRDALVLRFLQRRSYADLGGALGIGSDAARMRVERALERLRERLARRGLTSTAAALAVAIGHHGVVAAPVTLTSQVCSAAFLATASAAIPSAFLGLMNTTHVSVGLAAILAVGAVTSAVVTRRENASLRSDLAEFHRHAEAAAAESTNEGLASPAELQGLREDRLKLMALRDEVGRLREAQRRLAELEAENKRLLEAAQAQPKPAQSSSDEKTDEEIRQMGMVRMHAAKQWVMAFVVFASEHENRFPSNMEEAFAFHPSPDDIPEAVRGRFELMYRGSLTDIPDPARTIVLREREPFTTRSKTGQGTVWNRTYGFADGHSEIHASPDGNFDAWERERLPVDSKAGPLAEGNPASVSPR